jgi:hypothetical protein
MERLVLPPRVEVSKGSEMNILNKNIIFSVNKFEMIETKITKLNKKNVIFKKVRNFCQGRPVLLLAPGVKKNLATPLLQICLFPSGLPINTSISFPKLSPNKLENYLIYIHKRWILYSII